MQSHIVLYIVWVLKYYDTLLTILFVIFTWVNLLFWILLCINFLLECCIFHCLDIFYQYTILYWVLFGSKKIINIVLGIVLGLKKGYCPPLDMTYNGKVDLPVVTLCRIKVTR